MCDFEADFVLIGSGAGGSAAAAMLRAKNASFVWFEGGTDESHKLTTFPAIDPRSYPSNVYTPAALKFGQQSIPSAIPFGTGGMTSHYVGVQYWTLEDTVSSLQLTTDDDFEGLEFVRNHTNRQHVMCDAFVESVHTHPRASADPATEEEFASLPMCMYGTCKAGADACQLNKWFMASAGMGESTSAISGWHRSSSFLEYGSAPILGHRATSLRIDGSRATGVYLRENATVDKLACARNGVLLAAGVMGDSKIVLSSLVDEELSFFAQPVMVYYDPAVISHVEACDPGSAQGGTFHRLPTVASPHGFLSTLGICNVGGQRRIAWMTPQSVHPYIRGTIGLRNGSVEAMLNVNENESIMRDLIQDVEMAVRRLYNVTLNMSSSHQTFENAAYHWTGTQKDVYKSRFRRLDNVWFADAMGVTGNTSGWTSFNARVAGAVAANRALMWSSDVCADVKQQNKLEGCCTNSDSSVCADFLALYERAGCC